MIGIYAIQNKINGKLYIGQSIDIDRRWKQEKKCKKINKHLKRSIIKYGIDNFLFFVLEEVERKKLNEREKFYIKLYHTLDSEYGYNETSGGDSSYIRSHQKLTEEHKTKISLANKGHKLSKETIEKMRKAKKKKVLEKHKIDIWCLETNEIYNSIEEIISKLNLNKQQLFKCLRNVSKSVNGYHVCYAREKDFKKWELDKKTGFSLTGGGTSLWKKNTREKISQKAKERWDNISDEKRKEFVEKLRMANLGKKLTEEHKRKISESQKGMKRKEGTGKNISLRKKEEFRKRAKRKILCLETNETFYTAQEAEEIMRKNFPKVNEDGIKRILNNKQKTCGGLHFEYIPI